MNIAFFIFRMTSCTCHFYTGHYAIDVSSNWRIIFQMNADKVSDIDLVDYH